MDSNWQTAIFNDEFIESHEGWVDVVVVVVAGIVIAGLILSLFMLALILVR